MPQQVHMSGVDHQRMKAKTFALQFVATTVLAVAAAWCGVASVQVSGIVPTNFRAADIIRQRCPLHLVRPEWIKISDQGDILSKWAFAEPKVRLLAVSCLWGMGIAVFAWWALSSRRHERAA